MVRHQAGEGEAPLPPALPAAASEPTLSLPRLPPQATGNSGNWGPAALSPCPESNGSATMEKLPCEAWRLPPPPPAPGPAATARPAAQCRQATTCSRARAHTPGGGLHPAGCLPARPLLLPGPHRQAAPLRAARPHCAGREDGHQHRCGGGGGGPRRARDAAATEAGRQVTRLPPQTSPSRSAGSAATWPSWWAPASPLRSRAAASSRQPWYRSSVSTRAGARPHGSGLGALC